MLSGPSADADSQFATETTVRQCNALPADFPEGLAGSASCNELLSLNATPDVTVRAEWDAGESAPDRLTEFAPGGYTIAGGAETVTNTPVGGIRLSLTLGLSNSPCSTPAILDVVLYNVALPDNAVDPSNSTNIAYPRSEGQPDRFGAWGVGSIPPDAGPDTIIDAGGDGRADAASSPIVYYPAHLLNYFGPVVPKAVYGGLSLLHGEWLPIYVVLFDAGMLPPANAQMGQPFAYVIGDPSAAISSPSVITDTCTPMSLTSMFRGNVGGSPRLTTPATSSTHFWMLQSVSRRDADQDGLDNLTDTCPTRPNAAVDADLDGIDDACDAAVGSGGDDVDSDGFLNRQDNCPQVANGDSQQIDFEVLAQSSADGGPFGDGIGTACDNGFLPSPSATCPAPDNVAPPGRDYVCQNNRPLSLTLDSSIANGRYHLRTDIAPKCIGGTDADGDGYCVPQDTLDAPVAGCPLACAMMRHRAWGGLHPGQQMDTDGDKFSDAMETYLGTDATKSCAWDDASSNETIDNWPLDLSDNATVNSNDVGAGFGFAQALGKFVGQDAFSTARFDMNNDGFISTRDLTGYARVEDFHESLGGKLCPEMQIPLWSQQ